MKRLITILTLAALISGISVAAFAPVAVGRHTDTENVVVGWNITGRIWLWIPSEDRAVGLVPGPPATPGGYPIYVTPAVERPLSVLVWTNLRGGFTLTVAARDIVAPPGARRVARSFDIRGGDLTTWQDLRTTRTLLSSTAPGSFPADDIDYRFRSNPAYHPPGDYRLTIVYTVTGN